MRTAAPIRVLQVLGSLARGGAETWLVNVLRQIDRAAFSVDFVVHSSTPGDYEEQVRALGSRVFRCLNPKRATQYAREFKSILREQGPYDVVHSHVHHFSGHVLHAARQAGVPMRVAHSHLDTSSMDQKAGILRRAYVSLMTRWINREATVGLAASEKAATALFGETWQADPRWQVLFCGIDLAPFRAEVDFAAVRDELSIPQDVFVVGHVGRFDPQKNHKFALEIFAEVVRRNPKALLLLIGEGGLRPAVAAQAAAMGLTERVLFAGARGDVPRVMLGAMDTFLFPSLFEGLPLVLIEAQAAGLPCVVSDTIADETMIVRPLTRIQSLAQSPATWAEEVCRPSIQPRNLAHEYALSTLASSSLNIETSSIRLADVYRASTLRSHVA